jgi:hypothetical protein
MDGAPFLGATNMDAWQKVWREGFAPQMTVVGLRALAVALEEDDPALIQGRTARPPVGDHGPDLPIDGACGVAFPIWKGDDLATVLKVERRFNDMCYRVKKELGRPTAVGEFLEWFDQSPRSEMRTELLAEVRLTLDGRAAEWTAEDILRNEG